MIMMIRVIRILMMMMMMVVVVCVCVCARVCEVLQNVFALFKCWLLKVSFNNVLWYTYISNKQPAPSRLKSRKSFLHAVQPLSQPPQTARLTLWEEQRIAKQHLAKLPIPTSEQLAPGHKSEWKLWKSLNRLRTGMGRSKTNLSKWYSRVQQIQPVNAGPQSRPCSTCWDAHFLKMNAAWKIWQLLMRRLSTVQEPGQTYD